MKDYTCDGKNSKFILEYTYEGNKLIVKFANGDIWPIAYTKENEAIILKEMRNQFEKNGDKKAKKCKRTNVVSGICMVSGLAVAGIVTYLNPTYVTYIASISIGTVSIIGGSFKIASNQSMLKDIEKNTFFFKYGEEINRAVLEKSVILTRSSKKIKNIVSEAKKEGINPFDFNTINYMDLDELKVIKENIEKDKYFKFTYQSDEKPKQKRI